MKNFVWNKLRPILLPLGTVAASLALPMVAQAGTITGVSSISGSGLGYVAVPVISTPIEGNDNQVGGETTDANIGVPIKRFDHTGNIDIVFSVRDSDPRGVTEYRMFESVDNNTFVNWSGYVMQLGFGTGGNFVASPAGDGLDFDAPFYDSTPVSSAFTLVSLNEDKLIFSGGVQSTGSEIYQFRIDVPDGITSFTLRQTPISVPEPSTMVLAFTAMAGLGFARFRRR